MSIDAKNLIWCEVMCSCCGATTTASGFYSPERIKLLEEETKDWISTERYHVVCPECQKVNDDEDDKRTFLGKRIRM
jgi:hypothetical protein